MPLEPLEGGPAIKLEGIAFEMRDEDDGRTVECVLTHEALMDVFQAPLQSQWLQVFEKHRDKIEAAASNVYDTGASGEPVAVTTSDLQSDQSDVR